MRIPFALAAFFIAVSGITVISANAQESATNKVSGIDRALFSQAISPGENFYLYGNEKWLEETKIPGDKSNYGIFTVLDDETRQQVRELIESAAASDAEQGSAAQKVGDLYESVLNVEARNQAGIEPIRPMLEAVSKIESKEDLSSTMGQLRTRGIGGPVVPYISVDAKDSDSYTVYVTQSGLTMPDRDYYIVDEDRYKVLRDQMVQYATDMLAFADHPAPAKAAKAILELETQIAQIQWTKTQNRDPKATYNPHTAAEVDQMLGSLNWLRLAEQSNVGGRDKYVVRQPSFFTDMAKIFEETPLQTWKDYLTFHVLDDYASGLTETIEKRHFDFHETAISGIAEQQPMWKRGVDVTGEVLGELVGQLYVEKHFKPEAKQRMTELVDNLKRAFADRIRTRDWMGDGTKMQALEKLSKFNTKIGYPDEWKDYSKLQIDDGTLADHLIASAEFEYQRDVDRLGEPVDRNEWHMTPQTINAYYSPTMNEIVFPAAILQPPFFNMAADDAVNYGGIGAVIGHEISHGFDDKGSEYDGNGNLRMWWTEDDRKEFERRAEGLVGQFNKFEPEKGNFVNGELTLGENIGDLGGLSVAYEAYRLSLDGKEAPVIDGLTGDQRFFLGWSQIWRRLYRKPELLRRLIVDPHSPSEYRVNGIVRNMDAWYEAFGIKPEDKLYLAPEDRVRIW
ncbi:M13 family metallopeptidase [Stieleria varia]|uniref:Neutral endopeptidase n=1 Tax=Stieleria varia TaxID=2528005 RepID=A0A5C6AR30_9BACT|nr:M13 family metallopeptidase [Stieleria varia]TWU02415.1 Neutral endopeptidase [Stieleria varia]